MVIIFLKHAPKEYANGKGPFGKPLFDPKCISLKPNGSDEQHTQKHYSLAVGYIIDNIKASPLSFYHTIRIVSSPYTRARETARYLKIFLEEYLEHERETLGVDIRKNVCVRIDAVDGRIGEYLGNQKSMRRPLTRNEIFSEKFFYKESYMSFSLRDEAYKMNMFYPTEKSIEDLEKRCESFVEDVISTWNFSLVKNVSECLTSEEKSGGEKEHIVYVSHGVVIQKIMECFLRKLVLESYIHKFVVKELEPLRGYVLFDENGGGLENLGIKRF
jgi:hypothetical protein